MTSASDVSVSDSAEKKAFQAFDEIIHITSKIFGCDVIVKSSSDPEYPDDRHTVLVVHPSADVSTLMEMERRWVESVSQTAKNWKSLRLSIRPTA